MIALLVGENVRTGPQLQTCKLLGVSRFEYSFPDDFSNAYLKKLRKEAHSGKLEIDLGEFAMWA